MKLFLISQDMNTINAYNSAVVVAPNEETAANMDPGTGKPIEGWGYLTWCKSQYVKVLYLGEAVENLEEGVICASYNKREREYDSRVA